MALDKQKIALPIVDGLDTKGDEKTILPTRFLELENVDFTSPGAISKRNGYEALPNKTLDGDKIETGSALTSLKDELLQYSNNRLFSFSEGEQAWEDKGEVRFCSAYASQISAANGILKNPSFYSYGGVSCYAYEKEVAVISHSPSLGPDIYDIHEAIEIVIVDDVSNAVLATHTLNGKNFYGGPVDGFLNAPKVGFVGSSFVVFYYIGKNSNNQVTGPATGLTYSTINFLNPKVITHQITSSTTPTLLQASGTITVKLRYDVVSFNSRCFISYFNPDAPDTLVRYIDSGLNLSPIQSTGFTSDVHNISLNKEDTNLRILISAADGQLAKAYLFTFNLTSQVHAPLTIPLVAPNSGQGPGLKFPFVASANVCGIFTISGYQDPLAANRTYFIWQAQNISTTAGQLLSATVDSNGTFTLNANPLMNGAELQSKVVSSGDYIYYYVSKVVNSSQVSNVLDPDQPTAPTNTINKPVRTIFLMKALQYNSEIAAKFEVDAHVVVDAKFYSGLPNAITEDLEIRLPVASVNGLQPVNATTLLAPSVIKILNADFTQSSNYFDATQGESLYISGGLLKQYDGSKVVEAGFLDSPEPIKEIATTGGAGFGDYYVGNGLTAGQKYFYVVVYKWTDRTGKVHYSAPSRAVETSVPGSSGEKYVNITFTPLYFTNKETVEIELYRTTGNGTNYYKVAQVADGGAFDDYLTGGYPNNNSVQSVSVIDSVTDVELVFSEPLYTTGGILENDAPESSNFVAPYKSRLFLVLSDGYTLQYSKTTGIGDPVRFNSAFKIPMDAFGGKATCATAMDDHLIIFKERAIFAMTGEGPNDLGAQDDYRTPYLVTSDAGCIDPNSLVNNPNGIMFKSSKGIYMLKRNFTLQYIGDSVEAYNNESITTATLHPTLNQIRLVTSSGTGLVYDYYCNRWSTYTNYHALDSISFGADFYYVKASGLVMKETKGRYLDNGQFIRMRIKSAWIQIGGVQGFERFYKMLLLGTFHNAHKLQVSLSYDFNSAYQQQVLIDAGTLLSTPVYGADGENYGDSSPYGGEFPLYQFLIYPKIQKCQSFQFELSDSKTEIDGASFTLSQVVAEVGIKKGVAKKSDTRSFGTK